MQQFMQPVCQASSPEYSSSPPEVIRKKRKIYRPEKIEPNFANYFENMPQNSSNKENESKKLRSVFTPLNSNSNSNANSNTMQEPHNSSSHSTDSGFVFDHPIKDNVIDAPNDLFDIKNPHEYLKEWYVYDDPQLVKTKLEKALRWANKQVKKGKTAPEFKAFFSDDAELQCGTFNEGENVFRFEKEMECFAVSKVAIQGRRPYMEDATLAKEMSITSKDGKNSSTALYAIFDGHGGDYVALQGAQFFDHFLKIHLEDQMRSQEDGKGIFNALKLGFVHFNRRVLQVIKDQKFIVPKPGSTGVVALFHQSKIWVSNLGDSSAALFYQSKEGKWLHTILAREQKPNDKKMKRSIEKLNGYVSEPVGFNPARVNSFLACARAFGNLFVYNVSDGSSPLTARPKVTCIDEMKGTNWCLVMVSDGFSDLCEWEDLREFIGVMKLKGLNDSQMADCLVRAAYKSGSKDNITVMIISPRAQVLPEEKA